MKKRFLLILVLVLICFSFSIALAQSNADIRINLITTLETEDAMLLKIYFNLYDEATGTPYTSLNAKNAEITLLNTNFTSPATIKEPDVPIYITLLMDSSGSMGGSASQLREAAKLALNNTPRDSQFAVVQFDENIKLLQDYTENLSAIEHGIDQYQSAASGTGTCLYDAAYTTVEAQADAPPGRRAVILFTDGKDEKLDGSQCSQHSYQDVVNLAMEMQVPIHTIGLSKDAENINELELKSMSSSTGGFTFIASEADLDDAFARIMETLRAQWMVEATVYPRKGTNEAVMSLTLEDNTLMNQAFSFTSETEYSGPPSPVQVQFSGLQLLAETQTYEVQLTVTSPDMVSYIKISLWDSDAGSKVADYVFEDLSTFNALEIPTNQMIAERSYEFRIIAVSAEDNIPFVISTDDDGDPISEIIHEFTFDPTSIYASAKIDSVTQAGSTLQLNITLTNPDLIGGFDGWLVDGNTNTQVANSSFTSDAINSNTGMIEVQLADEFMDTGKYTIVLRVLSKNGEVFTSSQYQDFVYTASTAGLSILSIEQDGGDLVLNISVTNPEKITSYDGWVVDKATNKQMANSEFELSQEEAEDGSLVIPVDKMRLPSAKYIIVVRGLDASGNPLFTTESTEVSYSAPNIFQRLGVALIAAPIFIVVIVAIIIGIVVFFMITSSREKSLSGTPVMQGRMGKSLKNESGPALASIADEEPIPMKGKKAPAPSVQQPPPAPPAQQQRPAQPIQPAPRQAQTPPQTRPTIKPTPETEPPTMVGETMLESATMVDTNETVEFKPVLVGLSGSNLGEEALFAFPFTVGRGADCSLTLQDPRVSRTHARITRQGISSYFLEDLNSSNGTFINDMRINPGQEMPIKAGDKLQFGKNIIVRFEIK